MNDQTIGEQVATFEKGTLSALNAGSDIATDAIFGTVAKATTFLPRLQLFTAANDDCKKGSVPMNNYGLVVAKDKIQVIGKTVDVMPLSWRPKAMEIFADGTIINTYDAKNDPEFKRIALKSDLPNSGCMYGPEFLIWIPVLQRFGTFFMSSKSARNEAPVLKQKLDAESAATLDSKYIEGKKFSWQAPVVRGCSTPLELPPMDQIADEIQRFRNPPKNEVEKVEPQTSETTGEVRAR